MFYNKPKKSMKKTASKSRIFTKVWKLSSLIVLAGLVGVACEREGNGKKTDGSENTISLKMVSGASQTNRIQSIDFKHQAKLPKRKKLSYVATLNAPAGVAEYNWSATSVAIAPDNSVADGRNLVYVTWHSDRQATNQATAWGGAIDVLNVLPGQTPEVKYTYTGVEGKSEVKFNHVLVSNNNLFVSGTSWKHGGTIARMPLSNGEPVATSSVECIGFPGSSVNAVAEYNGKLVAISGYKGTYAEFDPAMEAAVYNYDHPDQNAIKPATEERIVDNFGGKYVVSSNGKTYLLYCGEEHGMLQEIGGEPIDLGKALTSTRKGAETYNEATGEWDISTDLKSYYGKHTMAIKGNFAYVACGTNGLVGINMETKAQIAENGIGTIGLCIDGDFLYAATGSGLRVYSIEEDGSLTLFAYEVETYDATTGEPTSETAATTGTETRHSANYVAVDANTGYIYVAYGQSGVRVYQLNKNTTPDQPEADGVDMGGGVLWATENLPGYYAWGELFTTEDAAGTQFSLGGTTFTNDGSYYTFSNSSKTSYKNFTNYKFFDGTEKLTKYTWLAQEPATPEDGKTVLEPMDDAATVRLGNGWRMPTAEEWVELIDKAQSIEETEQDGVSGLLITAENGNKLFLKQTGYYNYSGSIAHTDEYYYWSSSLSAQTTRNSDLGKNLPGGSIEGGDLKGNWCTESLASGFYAYFAYGELIVQMNSGKELGGFDRCFGMKIRPVKDK